MAPQKDNYSDIDSFFLLKILIKINNFIKIYKKI